MTRYKCVLGHLSSVSLGVKWKHGPVEGRVQFKPGVATFFACNTFLFYGARCFYNRKVDTLGKGQGWTGPSDVFRDHEFFIFHDTNFFGKH